MNILSGITQVGAVIETVRDVIGMLKPSSKAAARRPAGVSRPPSSGKAGTRFLDELNKASLQFIQIRDTNGNGSLDIDELGLGARLFHQWDLNGDDALTVAELHQAYLTDPDAFSRNGIQFKA